MDEKIVQEARATYKRYADKYRQKPLTPLMQQWLEHFKTNSLTYQQLSTQGKTVFWHLRRRAMIYVDVNYIIRIEEE